MNKGFNFSSYASILTFHFLIMTNLLELKCYVWESDMYFPKDNESGQRGDGKSEHQQFRNQWTKMDGNGKFNSDDSCIYYCGQESLGRSGVALIVNKRLWNTVLGCNLKNDWMTSVCFQVKLLSYYCWWSWSWMSLWRPSRTNTKDDLFIKGTWMQK